MATTPPVIQAKITSDPVKLPVFPLMTAIVLGVVVSVSAVGGSIYYLLHSGKLRIPVSVTPAAGPLSSIKTHPVALEPLLVNLADVSGTAYLRVALTLQIEDAPAARGNEGKEAESKDSRKEPDAALRDTALAVLGRQTSDSLLTADGKERLKKELRQALAERNPELKVTDLFFTEFLVQR
jgi:flagellar protein FliL